MLRSVHKNCLFLYTRNEQSKSEIYNCLQQHQKEYFINKIFNQRRLAHWNPWNVNEKN